MEDKKINGKRYQFHAIMIFFIVVFCTAIAPKTLQNDTFYTIKVGEYISQNGIFNLKDDPFSWIDLPYTFPHWLYDLTMYEIYSLGGMSGIYLSTIIFTSLLGISIYFTSNKLSKDPPISAIVTLIAMYLIQPYIAARAQLVTFSLLVLTIYITEKFLETSDKKYGIGLVLMSLLIVNLHMAVWPFFFVLFIPYILEYILSLNIFTIDLIIKAKILFLKKIQKKKDNTELIKKLEKNIKHNQKNREEAQKNPYKVRITRNDNIKKLCLILIICAAMGICTPTGLTTPYTYLYKTLSGNTMTVIQEHLPLELNHNQDFAAYFILFIAVLTFIDIKIDFKHLCYYLGILYLALNSKRQVSMFLIICTPVLAKLLGEIFAKYSPKLKEQIIDFIVTFYVSVALCITVVIASSKFIKQKLNDPFYYDSTYPVFASQWIKENLDYKNIKLFNEYNYGSYLIYQGIPVIIDSRCDLYTPQYNTKTKHAKDGMDIFMDVQNVCTNSTDYKEIFEKYGVTHVITFNNSKIHKNLKSNSDYEKIYPLTDEEKELDNSFVIYEKVSQ